MLQAGSWQGNCRQGDTAGLSRDHSEPVVT